MPLRGRKGYCSFFFPLQTHEMFSDRVRKVGADAWIIWLLVGAALTRWIQAFNSQQFCRARTQQERQNDGHGLHVVRPIAC